MRFDVGIHHGPVSVDDENAGRDRGEPVLPAFSASSVDLKPWGLGLQEQADQPDCNVQSLD